MGYMKRASYYARVSSTLQRNEKTIESQIVELKRQIAGDGNLLVKEYVDDGYTGARLDRPAMDELRKDLKTDVFDVIYFLNTDRIAREVTYQTIIIAEILKYKKQIIINGKDYIHNPENKFTVTVLGAVAELERAKIIERTVRARQHRLQQGKLLGCGNNIYGYDYHKRTPTSDPYYTINEEEAKVVRYVFETYAKGQVGVNQITRRLEEMGAPTKRRKNIWRTSLIKCMTRNEMYTGIRYFNTMKVVREYANPIHGIQSTTKKMLKRDRTEWVGIEVPRIIPQKIFDTVQERIQWNRKKYRNPRVIQLLSSLVRCGECGSSFFAYRTHYHDKRTKVPRVIHKRAYKCNWRYRQRMHSVNNPLKKCHNKEVKADILEYYVWKAIFDFMLEPSKLKKCMDFLKIDADKEHKKLERQRRYIDQKIKLITHKKKRLVEIYTMGNLEKEVYVSKSQKYDEETSALKTEYIELAKRIPLLYKTDVVNSSIKEYCENARVQFINAKEFDSKRKFLLEHVTKIVFKLDQFSIYGALPITQNGNTEENKTIEFRIEGKVPQWELLGRRRKKPDFSEPITPDNYEQLLARNSRTFSKVITN